LVIEVTVACSGTASSGTIKAEANGESVAKKIVKNEWTNIAVQPLRGEKNEERYEQDE
jgi:hypothetical protein